MMDKKRVEQYAATLKTVEEYLSELSDKLECSFDKTVITMATLHIRDLEHTNKKLESENACLRLVLRHLRSWFKNQGYGIRKFASISGVSAWQMSDWTEKKELGEPDFVD